MEAEGLQGWIRGEGSGVRLEGFGRKQLKPNAKDALYLDLSRCNIIDRACN